MANIAIELPQNRQRFYVVFSLYGDPRDIILSGKEDQPPNFKIVDDREPIALDPTQQYAYLCEI